MKRGEPVAFLDWRGERRTGYYGETGSTGLLWIAAKKSSMEGGGWWCKPEQIVEEPPKRREESGT